MERVTEDEKTERERVDEDGKEKKGFKRRETREGEQKNDEG